MLHERLFQIWGAATENDLLAIDKRPAIWGLDNSPVSEERRVRVGMYGVTVERR